MRTALEQSRVDAGAVGQAQEVFDALAGLTFVVDFSDFSDRAWWLTPAPATSSPR